MNHTGLKVGVVVRSHGDVSRAWRVGI
jgi:hypothetical protein